jgi:hypothetical protein
VGDDNLALARILAFLFWVITVTFVLGLTAIALLRHAHDGPDRGPGNPAGTDRPASAGAR